MKGRVASEEIFLAAVRSVLPSRLVKEHLELDEKGIKAGGRLFSHSNLGSIYLVGAGKASAMMANEAENVLGDKITGGHVVVKYGFSCSLKHIGITEAGHPVPDRNSYLATAKILDIVGSAGRNDLVICMISGGGSSLLADLPDGISEHSMMIMHGLLVNSGASIEEINTVRKHLSLVKGGQLARTAHPAQIVSLIISDVPGDRIDVVASGPTVPDPTTFSEAVEVVKKYNLLELTPSDIMEYLGKGFQGIIPETPKPADKLFNSVTNIIIGNNRKALESASRKASELNFNALIVDDELQGDVSTVAEKIVNAALAYQSDEGKIKPACLLFGGETTLRLTGRGLGGRNQHLALLCSMLLKDKPGITVLAAGTDGNDGPTDAAGAVVDSSTSDMVLSKHIDILKYKNDFDSWHFFQKAGGHVVTGPTMTNVMDIIVVIVE